MTDDYDPDNAEHQEIKHDIDWSFQFRRPELTLAIA